MTTPESIHVNELVERALATGNAQTVKDIYQWGQFHGSVLSQHVLARLACPDDPHFLWSIAEGERNPAHRPVNLEAAGALAASLALRAKTDAERERALRVFEFVFRRSGDGLPAEFQDLHVITAHLCGRTDRARSLLHRYSDVTTVLGKAIHAQAAHPSNGGATGEFLDRLRDLTGWSDPIECSGGAPLSIDTLEVGTGDPVAKGPLISVVMTCFNPDESLLTAVRSVQRQTWQNWELLIVDDGSDPSYAEVLKRANAMDPRITVLVQPRNAGTYQARNRALAVAEGEFVTGLDSDDWAHPRRLELQVRPMLKDPNLVMVESRSLSTLTDLSLMIDPQVEVVATRSTPIMVRSEETRRHIGFYDEVRKSADSEYRQRIRHTFGKRRWMRLKSMPLTIVRYADTTLSAGEVSRHWMSPGRFAYHSGFSHWHRRIAKRKASGFLESRPVDRPFPLSVALSRKAADKGPYDRVYAADWRRLDGVRSAMLDAAARDVGRGLKVALCHFPEWVEVNGKRALIRESVLEFAAEHLLEFVDLRGVSAAAVVAHSDRFARLLRFEHPELEAVDVDSWGGGEEAAPEPAAPESPAAPSRTLPSPVGRRDVALLLAGAVPMAAGAALLSLWQPESWPWLAAGGAAAWLGAGSAIAGWRLLSRVRRRTVFFDPPSA